MCSFHIKYFSSIFFIVACYTSQLSKIKSTKLNAQQRIAVLRSQINNEIRQKLGKNLPIDDFSSFEADEYENYNGPITPVMPPERHRTKKMAVRTITTTAKTTTNTANVSTPSSQLRLNKIQFKNLTNILHGKNTKSKKPAEIFYRRLIDADAMNTEVPWTHCQDMITPYLTGAKKDLSHPAHWTTKNPVVVRFLQLMTVNTTLFTKEDIYSVLYQISKLQLRLFQWDVPAVNALFAILMKDTKHTFSNLKAGIRKRFQDWRLDISNVTNMLRQARIFRPPCVRISDSTGSTKSNKVSRYPKKTLPTTTCEYEEEFECKYRQ